MTVADVLHKIPSRRREDAIWLLSSFYHCSKAEVLLNRARVLTKPEQKRWNGWWKRCLKGEPLQYVAGSAPFYGREFLVDKHTLIPRPETERLVELSLGLLAPGDRVLDIGTGSGCIAITLKAEMPGLEVLGTDISASALSVAEKNSVELCARVKFEKHDLFSPSLSAKPWKLVVSNPPYLDFRRDKIAANVRRYEPRSALEPLLPKSEKATRDRASWCARRILEVCSMGATRYTALELSPRVAAALEKKWKKHPRALRVWREADLAGRKRFLLVAWVEAVSTLRQELH